MLINFNIFSSKFLLVILQGTDRSIFVLLFDTYLPKVFLFVHLKQLSRYFICNLNKK